MFMLNSQPRRSSPALKSGKPSAASPAWSSSCGQAPGVSTPACQLHADLVCGGIQLQPWQ